MNFIFVGICIGADEFSNKTSRRNVKENGSLAQLVGDWWTFEWFGRCCILRDGFVLGSFLRDKMAQMVLQIIERQGFGIFARWVRFPFFHISGTGTNFEDVGRRDVLAELTKLKSFEFVHGAEEFFIQGGFLIYKFAICGVYVVN